MDAAILECDTGFGFPDADGIRAGFAWRRLQMEVEGHFGFVPFTQVGEGSLNLPPQGRFLATPGGPSRHVDSWYFGDGAQLVNQVASNVGGTRIVPLDAGLSSSNASLGGLSGGLRLSRRISSRFTGEFNIDYNYNEIHLRDTLDAAADSSRASFLGVWRDLLSSSSIQNLNVTSTLDSRNKGGQGLTLTGDVRWNFRRQGRIRPYATFGMGTLRAFGSAGFVMTGEYQFVTGGVPIHERNTVTVRYVSGSALLGLAGAGFIVDRSSRWGFRADARVYAHKNAMRTEIDTDTVVFPGTPQAQVALVSNPTVGFSNFGQNVSSLTTSPKLRGYRVSGGAGAHFRIQAAVGIFRRF
jgi:hypothetical protein